MAEYISREAVMLEIDAADFVIDAPAGGEHIHLSEISDGSAPGKCHLSLI